LVGLVFVRSEPPHFVHKKLFKHLGMEDDEKETGGGRRGHQKALTWDQFHFDRLFPSLGEGAQEEAESQFHGGHGQFLANDSQLEFQQQQQEQQEQQQVNDSLTDGTASVFSGVGERGSLGGSVTGFDDSVLPSSTSPGWFGGDDDSGHIAGAHHRRAHTFGSPSSAVEDFDISALTSSLLNAGLEESESNVAPPPNTGLVQDELHQQQRQEASMGGMEFLSSLSTPGHRRAHTDVSRESGSGHGPSLTWAPPNTSESLAASTRTATRMDLNGNHARSKSDLFMDSSEHRNSAWTTAGEYSHPASPLQSPGSGYGAARGQVQNHHQQEIFQGTPPYGAMQGGMPSPMSGPQPSSPSMYADPRMISSSAAQMHDWVYQQGRGGGMETGYYDNYGQMMRPSAVMAPPAGIEPPPPPLAAFQSVQASGGPVSPQHQQQMLQYNQQHSPRSQNSRKGRRNGAEQTVSEVLQEYRASGLRPSVGELRGNIVEFARDASGSRYLQFLNESASEEVKEMLIDEVCKDAVPLMQDTFGNYVIQNLMEHASMPQRIKLGERMKTKMVALSCNAHGTRVVQRAITLFPKSLRNTLLSEIVCNAAELGVCARNSFGTHCVQKLMTLIVDEEHERAEVGRAPEVFEDGSPSTTELLRAAEKAVARDFLYLATHPHSYRLVLSVLDDCDMTRSEHMPVIFGKLKNSQGALAKDQHANFVLQHILNRGTDDQKEVIQRFASENVVELSTSKFSSHLVEKCLRSATSEQAERLVSELIEPRDKNLEFCTKILGETRGKQSGKKQDSSSVDDPLLLLMQDPYANFVVQRAFDASRSSLRARLTAEIKTRSEMLQKFTYGRHILLHINKVTGGGGSEKKHGRGNRGRRRASQPN